VLTFDAHSPEQQEELGAAIASVCPRGCVIYLQGQLGAGKTTLVRGFLRGLGYEGAVKSPTYTLLEPYELKGQTFCHFDLYRLSDAEELEYLGIRDLLQDEAVLLVEWPERGEGELPTADIQVRIHYLEQGRSLELNACSEKGREMLLALRQELQAKLNNSN